MPRDYSWNHLRPDDPLLVPPIGGRLNDTSAVRHERCYVELDNAGGIWCGREKGHEGAHSVCIFDSDRTYVWPRKEGEDAT
jgi:hypothetical protein